MHSPLWLLSTGRARSHLSTSLQEEGKMMNEHSGFTASHIPSLIMGSMVKLWPGFITPMALFSG